MGTPALSRQESKMITRHRLLEAGLKLLIEEGYAGLSANKIAKAAGISQPSFYVHFEDKDHLLYTLAEERLSGLRSKLRESRMTIRKSPTPQTLREVFKIPLEFFLSEPDIYQLSIQERRQPHSPFGRYARELEAEYKRDLIADMQELGFSAKTAKQKRRMEMIADLIVNIADTLSLGVIEGRYRQDEILDLMVEMATAAFLRAVSGARKSPKA